MIEWNYYVFQNCAVTFCKGFKLEATFHKSDPCMSDQFFFKEINLCYCLAMYMQATGRSALFMASEQGSLEMVGLLVKGGASVDLTDKVHW